MVVARRGILDTIETALARSPIADGVEAVPLDTLAEPGRLFTENAE